MKSLKIIATGLFALSASSLAFAYGNPPGHVNVSGSTAFRAAANAAILASFDPFPAVKYAYNSTSLGASNQAVFVGNTRGSRTIVKTSFQGSIGGMKALATNTAPNRSPFYTDAQATANAFVGGAQIAAAAADPELADFALSDADIGEAPFRWFGDSSPDTLGSTAVGVIGFKFVAAEGSNAGITNITGQQFPALVNSTAGLPLSFFTGNPANTGRVYATGEDDDSGTRLVAFQETLVGSASAVVHQWQTLPAGGTGAPTGIAQFPAIVGHPAGYTGYASGSNVKTELSRDISGLAPSVAGEIGYLGQADAAGAVAAGAIELTYNGSLFSAANIQEGKYSLWGYEWVIIDSQANADAQYVATTVVETLSSDGFIESFGAGISLFRMDVGRSASGAVIWEGSRF